MQKISAEDALTVIESENALIKITSAPPTTNRCLDYILKQLNETVTYRPVKTLTDVHRHRYFDPRDGKWYYRPVEDRKRGMAKNTSFTKKTSVSLLSFDGVMQLFSPKHGFPVGFIFDLRYCNLKNEKYVFLENVNTDTRWWLRQKNVAEDKQIVFRSSTLQDLRNHIRRERQAGRIPKWNEILACLSKDALVGISTQHSLEDRLTALYVKYEIKERMQKDIPIIILDNKQGMRIYDEEWQQHDVAVASRWDSFIVPSNRLEKICSSLGITLNPLKTTSLCNQEIRMNELQALQSFFVSRFTPECLMQEVLSYLHLGELLIFNNAIKGAVKFKYLFDIVNKLIEQNLIKDLYHALLVNAHLFSTKFHWVPKNKEVSSSYKLIFDSNQKIFSQFKKTLFSDKREVLEKRPEVIERNLAHIYYSDPASAVELLVQACKENHTQVVKLLLDYGIVRPFSNYRGTNLFFSIIRYMPLSIIESAIRKAHRFLWMDASNIVQYSYSDETFNTVGSIRLTPVLVGALYRKINVVEAIANYYPNQMIESLAELRKTNKGSPVYLYFDKDKQLQTDRAHVKLLLQLQQKEHSRYILSYAEKRMVERYLLKRIKKLQTTDEAEAFWNKHKEALYLNQRRHTWFDGLFRSPAHMTTIKKNVFMALEKKKEEIESIRLSNSHVL